MSFLVFQSQGLRIFKGDTATVQNYTGQAGELSINTETKAVYVHDGLTAGGTPLTTASEAEMLGMTLGQLANVYLDSQTDKSIVAFNQADNTWRSIEGLKLGELLDMVLSSPNEGDLLSYDSATQKWINVPASTGGAGATNLTGLDDVNLTAPTNNQVLTYDETAGRWVNMDAASGGGGGAGLPKIDWGDYSVTMDGQVDNEVSPDGSGYFYRLNSSGSEFSDKSSMFDYDPDNSSKIMLSWDFQMGKWKLVDGSDFISRQNGYTKQQIDYSFYKKTEVDAAIAAGGGSSSGGSSGMPIGSIVAWPLLDSMQTVWPEGFLACVGTMVKQADYPDLFQQYEYYYCANVMVNDMYEVIGDYDACKSYQQAKPASERWFCLPDLRNKLLVGGDLDTNYYYMDFFRPGQWFYPNDIAEAVEHEMTWNDTNAGPTFLDYTKPWINPMGVETPLMPKGRIVSYICRAF